MAIDFLPISKTARTNMANQAITLANQLIDLCDRAEALRDAASGMHDGSNYGMVEAQFMVGAGNGGNFVTMLQQVHDILNTDTDVTGVNRLARLKEYARRLAGQ